jgi:fructose-bisphosphate aldolase class II
MLVNLKEILAPAVGSGYAVGCFNVFGYEDARAIVDAGEVEDAPVILAANRGFVDFMPVKLVAGILRNLAETSSVPVCVHLDHSSEIDAVLRAVDAGFTSVMYDGSQLTLERNIAGTRRVAEYAHSAGCSLEAEIGSVPYAEGNTHIKSELTEPYDAVRLANEGGLDALAISVGNVHRLKEPGAKIDYARLAEIEALVSVPLVIHGTSGLFDQDIARLARRRVAKFNIGTRLRQTFGSALRQTLVDHPERFDRLEIMCDVIPAMALEAQRMIRLLGWHRP